jgi:MOSC domain-containing protein YiiM
MPSTEMQHLLEQFPHPGTLEHIFLRPARHAAIDSVQNVTAEVGRGLVGDYRAEHTPRDSAKRQVTLIQAEHLPVIAALAGRALEPAELAKLLRRNLVVRGINLLALKAQTFRIGEVVLAGSGLCAPCSQMEDALGTGGYNAMRGHGGITARVLLAGTLRIGDRVLVEEDAVSSS